MNKSVINAHLRILENYINAQCLHNSTFVKVELPGQVAKRCTKCGKSWAASTACDVDAHIEQDLSLLTQVAQAIEGLKQELSYSETVEIGKWDGVLRHNEVLSTTYRLGSAWIQSGEGVQLIHMPTQIKVSSGEDRSVHRNYSIALSILKQELQVYCEANQLQYIDEFQKG